jgi:diketogulonate reductase-like aldo/keto reductase
MRTYKFGTLGRAVPLIGQGTWNLPERGEAVAEARKALKLGLDLGMTHLDTAEMYGAGRAEEAIAAAIQGYPREQLFIVSKVLPDHASYDGTIEACEKSLQRMKIDYMDCYLLHWRSRYPLSQTMGALEQLVDDGKILSFGVSNFDFDDLVEAQQVLKRHPIACNQVLYNLRNRGIERRLIPFCTEQNIAVVGYTPFGQRALPSLRTAGGAVLTEVAEKHNATVPQVILAFLVRMPNVFAIPKSANIEHTEENAGAGDLILDEEDIQHIGEAFPAPDRDVPLAML